VPFWLPAQPDRSAPEYIFAIRFVEWRLLDLGNRARPQPSFPAHRGHGMQTVASAWKNIPKPEIANMNLLRQVEWLKSYKVKKILSERRSVSKSSRVTRPLAYLP
jgi:hypothetical protein